MIIKTIITYSGDITDTILREKPYWLLFKQDDSTEEKTHWHLSWAYETKSEAIKQRDRMLNHNHNYKSDMVILYCLVSQPPEVK